MRCLMCRRAETRAGTTTVTLERDGLTCVVRNVPAQACPNCGEAYVDEAAARRLLERAEAMARAGDVGEVSEYAAA